MEDTMTQDITGDNTEPQRAADISDGIFARRLLLLRKTAGLTQEQLAERMAAAGNMMHRSAIAKIESGDRSVSVGEAVQFAGVLGIDLSELTTDRSTDTEREKTHRARVELQVRIRSLEHLAEERHRLLLEDQFLLENTVDRLQAAREELSTLDLRAKVRDQQDQFGAAAWMAPDSEDDK
jgi:transcriptional regulator with XRE-family HTH domain